jgi:hypothetical protein
MRDVLFDEIIRSTRPTAKEQNPMNSANLARVGGGLAAILGGLLIVVAAIVGLFVDFENVAVAATGSYILFAILSLLGAILVLGALVGLYARQAEQAGSLGLLAFLVTFLGMALVVGASWTSTFTEPALAQVAPELLAQEPPGWLDFGFTLTYVLASLGWLLFGVATLRARVYPRAAAIILIVGALISFLPLPLTEVILAIAIAWLGFELFTGRGVSLEQPARVR